MGRARPLLDPARRLLPQTQQRPETCWRRRPRARIVTSATSHAQPVYSLPSTRQHLQPRGPSALPPPPRDRPTREHRSMAARRVAHRATVESASAPCGSPMVVMTPACLSCNRAEAQLASASQGASASVDAVEPNPPQPPPPSAHLSTVASRAPRLRRRRAHLLARRRRRRDARSAVNTAPPRRLDRPCTASARRSPCIWRRIFRADRRLASNPRRAHDAPSPPSSAAATPPPRAAQTPSSPRSTTCTPSASITRLRA